MSRPIHYLVVHAAATPSHMDIGFKEIDRWHREKGWLMIGYHFVIRRDGTVEPGRPVTRAGAHVRGYNANSIGICMVGGESEDGGVMGNFTPEQFKALRELLFSLLSSHPEAEVLGHRDFPGVAKSCPCFDVKEWWNLMPE